MRKNTQIMKKTDTKNVDFGTPFGTHVPPMCCQCAVFLRPGAWNLPVGDPRCDLYGILLDLGAILVTFGTHVDRLWANANRSRFVFTLFSKSFPRTHKHTNPQVGSAGARSVMNYCIGPVVVFLFHHVLCFVFWRQYGVLARFRCVKVSHFSINCS